MGTTTSLFVIRSKGLHRYLATESTETRCSTWTRDRCEARLYSTEREAEAALALELWGDATRFRRCEPVDWAEVVDFSETAPAAPLPALPATLRVVVADW